MWLHGVALWNMDSFTCIVHCALEAEFLVRNCALRDTMFSQWCWHRFSLLEYDARTGEQRVFKFNTEYGRMGDHHQSLCGNWCHHSMACSHCTDGSIISHYAAINYMLIYRLHELILHSAGHLVVTYFINQHGIISQKTWIFKLVLHYNLQSKT